MTSLADGQPAQGLVAQLDAAHAQIARVVRGNPQATKVVLAAVMADGHVLIEDVPGVGKTTLARTSARVLGCRFSRIQFTSDMLPSDVSGGQILDPDTGTLRFRKGPLFAQIVLADEINRASPKTQSALLEAMADRQVTVDDETHPLPRPFFLIATQNPIEHHGAYPLPESQLDRFLVRIKLGYPPKSDERALLLEPAGAESAFVATEVVLSPDDILAIQARVKAVRVDETVADYMLALADETRRRPEVALGVSPRGTLAWARLCRAWAFFDGRDFVLPDDVKAMAPYVLPHRLVLVRGDISRAEQWVAELLDDVPVPR